MWSHHMTSSWYHWWHHAWHHRWHHVVPPHDITKSLHQSNGLGLTIGPTLGPKTQSIKSMDLDLVVGLSQHLGLILGPHDVIDDVMHDVINDVMMMLYGGTIWCHGWCHRWCHGDVIDDVMDNVIVMSWWYHARCHDDVIMSWQSNFLLELFKIMFISNNLP